MTAEERTAKLKEWDKTLDEATRTGLALSVQAFDKWLDEVEKGELDESTTAMLQMLAANRYNVGDKSGLAMMFTMFAEGFFSGMAKALDLT